MLLGPDGAGKSTALVTVLALAEPMFAEMRTYHFSSKRLVPIPPQGIIDQPHAKTPRGPIFSTLRIFAWLFEFMYGYLAIIRPALVRSALVVSDRYFIDIAADPVRYRYGGSLRLVVWLWRIIPTPDIIVLLDAPVEVLRSRKQEVDASALEHARVAYRTVIKAHPHHYIIDTSASPEAVGGHIVSILRAHLNARC